MKTETLEPVEMTASVSTSAMSRDDDAERINPVVHLKNILVPLDFSEMSLKSLKYAVPFAQQFGAKVTLLHVVEPTAYTQDFTCLPALGTEHRAAVQKQLEDIRMTIFTPELPVEISIRHNFVFDGIVEAAREIRADLIITTTHGHTGLNHLLMGSTAENIVRRAPCSWFAKSNTTSYETLGPQHRPPNPP
jgi:universal stress protein A